MRELLARHHIEVDMTRIYEFPSIQIPWYSKKHKTNLEIEFHQERDGHTVLLLIFALDAVGIIERTPVFTASFDDSKNYRDILVAKELKEAIVDDLELEFLPEMNAYSITDTETALFVLDSVLSKFSGQAPMILGGT